MTRLAPIRSRPRGRAALVDDVERDRERPRGTGGELLAELDAEQRVGRVARGDGHARRRAGARDLVSGGRGRHGQVRPVEEVAPGLRVGQVVGGGQRHRDVDLVGRRVDDVSRVCGRREAARREGIDRRAGRPRRQGRRDGEQEQREEGGRGGRPPGPNRTLTGSRPRSPRDWRRLPPPRPRRARPRRSPQARRPPPSRPARRGGRRSASSRAAPRLVRPLVSGIRPPIHSQPADLLEELVGDRERRGRSRARARPRSRAPAGDLGREDRPVVLGERELHERELVVPAEQLPVGLAERVADRRREMDPADQARRPGRGSA